MAGMGFPVPHLRTEHRLTSLGEAEEGDVQEDQRQRLALLPGAVETGDGVLRHLGLSACKTG